MSDILHFLQQRNSSPKLTDPAPSPQQMEEIFQAAMRAPDHAWLRPWRFITIAGTRREAFGELLEAALVKRNPGADAAAREKARNAPLRAPLLVVTVVTLTEHPKVPPIEQRLSAGCAAHGVLLAAQALGFAGVWRTGDAAFDREVMTGLGLGENEEIVGLLYLGSRLGNPKPLPTLNCADFVSHW
ncbi:MAG: nitroreductase family protein [Gammaproteobacteria bacterium]|jgi:nitroreductase|nr:nitroreductase family protein [Gammaproteobacteria bacterium]